MSVTDLGKAVEDRRFQLDLSQEALVNVGGPSHQIVRNIEKGVDTDYRGTTFRKLDRALRWAPGSAKRLMIDGTPPTELTSDPARADWEALGSAVKARRVALRLAQDLGDRGGPSEFTVRRLERAEADVIRPKTKTQLESVLSWPRGTVDDLLGGELNPEEAAELPAPPDPIHTIQSAIDDDTRALRVGRILLALLDALEKGDR